MKVLTICAALLFEATAFAAGNVWVVAPSGGHFPTIHQAVNAASAGDIVLVKSGGYTSFTLERGVAVAAEVPGMVAISGTVVIRFVSAGQTALLHGMRVVSASTSAPGLRVQNNAGMVRVQQCISNGRNATMLSGNCTSGPCYGEDGGVGAVIESSRSVVFTLCSFSGGTGKSTGTSYSWYLDYGGQGAVALLATSSSLALFDCTLVGGSGGGSDFYPGHGGDACTMQSGAWFATKSAFTGGWGGYGQDFHTIPGVGGDGLDIVAAPAHALESTFTGGPGGLGGANGIDGQPVAGLLNLLPGTSRSLSCQNPIRDRQLLPLTMRGEPGEDVYLMVSRNAAFGFDTTQAGVQLVAQPSILSIHLGTVPASGTLTAQLLVRDAAAGPQRGSVYYFQCAFVNASGSSRLSNPVDLIVLDHTIL